MSSRITRSAASGSGIGSKSTASETPSLPSKKSAPKSKVTKTTNKPKAKTPKTKTSASEPQPDDPSKPVFFWREYGTPHCYLSQWYASPFHAPGPEGSKKEIEYQNAEQYMMHRKALLFSDYPIASQILTVTSPKAIKSLGRKVQNFSEEIWHENRSRIVEDASYYKFKNGEDKGVFALEEGDGEKISLRERLLRTGERELVEASPMDRIWGIGMREYGALERKEKWGLNLLGKALMIARDRLRAEQLEEEAKGEVKT